MLHMTRLAMMGLMRVRVRVTPGARREKCEETEPGTLIITVKEPAAQNAANARVRELLARHFHVPEEKVRMRTGARSGNKTFDVID